MRIQILTWALALSATFAAHGSAASPRQQSTPFVEQPGAFQGGIELSQHNSFGVIANDMDLDGDLDVLVNWHHLAPLELFENRDGQFQLCNVLGEDPTGLRDNWQVPNLFAEREPMGERIAATETPGLYVWHGAQRKPTLWFFHIKGSAGQTPGLAVEIKANREISDIEGLEDAEVLERSAMALKLQLAPGADRAFQLEVKQISTRLEVSAQFTGDGSLFAGSDLTAVPNDHLIVWKPDPHGMAWLNLQGSPLPDLYITRGGLRGKLLPPLAPKLDRFFEATDQGWSSSTPRQQTRPLYHPAVPSLFPADYARGRGVEWVDVDGDGVLELSVSAKKTPNRLMVRTGKHFVNHATKLGIGFVDSEVQAWSDFDNDGRQDLFYIADRQVHLARNVDGKSFELIPGSTLGMELPPLGRPLKIINYCAIHLLDHDNDGDLDLWVVGYGVRRRTRVFARVGDGFVDVTQEVGLKEEINYETLVPLDIDNDGWLDFAALGVVNKLWRNRAGQRFEVQMLPREWMKNKVDSAVRCDADGDGRQDLVLVGSSVYLMRNMTSNGNGFLRVRLQTEGSEPIGALVTAVDNQGGRRAVRYGSADRTTFSQTLRPLHFGLAAGVTVERFEVRWPATDAAQIYTGPFEGPDVLLQP